MTFLEIPSTPSMQLSHPFKKERKTEVKTAALDATDSLKVGINTKMRERFLYFVKPKNQETHWVRLDRESRPSTSLERLGRRFRTCWTMRTFFRNSTHDSCHDPQLLTEEAVQFCNKKYFRLWGTARTDRWRHPLEPVSSRRTRSQ